MVGLLALSCALLIWASREPAKKWAPADAWRDNDEQVVIDTARVVVRVTNAARALKKQGLTVLEIAHALGVKERTVYP
jgi:hypothetical protein